MAAERLNPIPRKVHLVGIGGIHMSAIAQMLHARGHQVSGSDLRLSALTRRLEQMGIRVSEGHRSENLGDAALVVYTSAAKGENPELQEARRRGIPLLKRAEMVARLMEGKQVIAVAGSHGKTTTTSLISYMLWLAGANPTFMLGGEMIDLDTHFRLGDGPHFVVEADEYDAAFLQYHPLIALVTNIDADHLDYYRSFERLTETFRQFLKQVTSCIVACGEDPALQATVSEAVGDDGTPVPIISYGLAGDFSWSAEKIQQKGIDGYTFMVKCGKEVFGEFENRLAGVYNVRNCLGAIAVGNRLGLPRDAIKQAVAEFRGVKRRFELVGRARDIAVFDDYAHHPTEIEATLRAARERFPENRLVCLFQPHTYSRTRYLLEKFRSCFQDADLVLIAETYAAREEPADGMSAQQLAEKISAPSASYAGSLEEARGKALEVLRPGDVFFTVGAGDIDSVGREVLEALRR